MQIRSLALTAVTVGALGISGCGSSSDTKTGAASTTDAKTLLASTFQPSTGSSKIKSGDIKITANGKLTGTPGGSGEASAEIKLGQAKDGEIPEFSAAVKASGEETGGGKLDLDAGGVYVDGRFYVSYQGTNYDVGQELSARAVQSLKAAIKQSGASADSQKDVLGKLGLNPQTWLIDPEVEGTEKIGGVDTYKISGAVNIKTLVPDVLGAARKAQALAPGSSTARTVPTVTDAQLDAVSKQIKKLDVTVWTGKDDHILRQLKVDLDASGAKASDELSGSIQLTLTDVNEQQDIKAPSNTKPVTDLIPKLNGLFGAAAGAAASGSSGAGNAAVSEAYIECVNKAGNDAAKLNACQSDLK
ncbi:MAG: hypothetical protein AAGC46_09650 [Solirubrobacteraceae bacterium]|nr:hypothetical protein [Patulibacter sp.]